MERLSNALMFSGASMLVIDLLVEGVLLGHKEGAIALTALAMMFGAVVIEALRP